MTTIPIIRPRIVGESVQTRQALVQGVSMSVRERRCVEMFHDMGLEGCPERAAARMITDSLTAKRRIQFIDEECRCDLCREDLEVRETDGHMSSPRQLMAWGTVITIDGLDIDLEREQVQTWGIFCDRCARDLRAQTDRRLPAALAYRAAQAIPVTDETVNLRARALEAIGELEVEARR